MALRPLEPKSSASASSATLAQAGLFALYRPPKIDASARVRRHAALDLRAGLNSEARSLAAARARRAVDHVARQGKPWTFYVQSVVSFAFAGQQLPSRSNDLLEHGNAKRTPERIAIGFGHARRTGTLQHNDRVRQRRDQISAQAPALFERPHDRRGLEMGGIFRPTPWKYFHRLRGKQRGTKPRHENGRARGRRHRIGKRLANPLPGKSDQHVLNVV